MEPLSDGVEVASLSPHSTTTEPRARFHAQEGEEETGTKTMGHSRHVDGHNDLVDTTVDVDEYNTPRLLILISVLPIPRTTPPHIFSSPTLASLMCVTGLTLLFGEPCDPCPPLSWRQSCEVQFSISLNLSAFLCFG